MLLVSGATRTMARLGPSETLGRLFVPTQGDNLRTLADGWQWAADNGCFTGLDVDAWIDMLNELRGLPGCLFVVVPDKVADAKTTLKMWQRWSPVVHAYGYPAAFVAQDGCQDVPASAAELFIGGTTDYKLSREARDLVDFAHATGRWVHMGRVNTRKRMRIAASWGVDSIDGSKFSRWSETHLPTGIAWARAEKAQPWLWRTA